MRKAAQCLTMILFSLLLVQCSKDSEGDNNEEPINITLGSTTLLPITVISNETAVTGGTIVSNGNGTVSAKGVCWGTNPNPTINDFVTNDGNGDGPYTSTLTALDRNLTYYVRSYATNESGTAYSNSLTFSTASFCEQNVVNNQVLLYTQEEVNEFGALNVCTINSQLFIRAPQGGTSDIVDLTPLVHLEKVEGLYISDLPDLESLEGLNNLSEVTEALYIVNNDKLINIDPLSNITSPLQDLVIDDNNKLTNIDGLSGLTTFVNQGLNQGPSIGISRNTLLQNINGLGNITSFYGDSGGSFNIVENALLTDIDSIQNFSQDIVRVILFLNYNLHDISGLWGMGDCTVIYIGYNSINDFSALQNVTSVQYDFEISGEDMYSLNGLQNLNFVGGDIKFSYNSTLLDFCDLLNLVNSNGLQGNYTVENNLSNPTYEDLENGNCF